LLRAGIGAMVSVMKEHSEAQLRFQRKDGRGEFGSIPLVDEHHIGPGQLGGKKLAHAIVQPVKANIELRKGLAETGQSFGRTVALQRKISDGPAVALFVAAHFVSKIEKLLRQPAQEVGVAMVPVGEPRMGKDPETQTPVHATLAVEQTS